MDCILDLETVKHFRVKHFENGEKVTVAKFELAFTRYQHNLRTVGNLMVKSCWRTLMPKKSTYTLRIDQSLSKSVVNCSVYIIVKCSHAAVSNLCQLGFPCSKSIVFEICWQKMWSFHVNGRPIHHIFHCFQNVLASCERSLRQTLLSMLSEDSSIDVLAILQQSLLHYFVHFYMKGLIE